MELGLQQSLRGELQLRLSPQILQRIEVLQLPALDLAGLIEQELQENETLEVDPEAEPAEAPAEESDLEEYEEDEDWRDRPGADRATGMDVMTATAAALVGLAEHLETQLDLLDLKPGVRATARAIVQSLDGRGWLELDLSEVEVDATPPPTAAEREHALHVVQSLEPEGVGARDLAECLLLQLDEDDAEYELLVGLVLNHLDDIAHNRIPRIVRETGAGVERVLAAIDRIRGLDPIPGRRFGGVRAPHVKPDVVVRRAGEGYEIALENDWVPSLRLSPQYLRLARDRSVDPELRKHIRGKIEGAQSLIEAIEQRKHTLFRVASEIVNRQAGFLEFGKAGLRPLRMQEVADALSVHVSTISRAISGKYLQTPRGIVPMKELFTGEVPKAADAGPGESSSRAGVQELVRSIVATEDSHHPLSDEAIVAILKEREGLDIARRTVTKYRKALGLGSSRGRRRYDPS